MKGDVESIVALILLFLFVVLFIGDPDLLDKIIESTGCDRNHEQQIERGKG